MHSAHPAPYLCNVQTGTCCEVYLLSLSRYLCSRMQRIQSVVVPTAGSGGQGGGRGGGDEAGEEGWASVATPG